MIEEKEKKEIAENLTDFWKKTTRKKRQLLLSYLKKEGISQTTMYSYAKSEFKIEGVILRGLKIIVDEFQNNQNSNTII